MFMQFHQVPTYEALHEFIDKAQLTSEFGGTLSYSHQDWVKFRMVSLYLFRGPNTIGSLCDTGADLFETASIIGSV